MKVSPTLHGTKKRAMPKRFSPQLATLVKTPPDTKGWTYETKFDGYRLLAFIHKGKVKLMTRNGKNWTKKFPHIEKALKKLSVQSAILDGEVVALDKKKVSRFQLLQNSLEYGDTAAIRYFVFDLPYCDGNDLKKVPLNERKTLLKKVLRPLSSSSIKFSPDLHGNVKRLLKSACRARKEGLIAKKETSFYHNRRTPDWIKLKCTHRQELVIGGYTDPGGARKEFGSLLLGYYDKKGHLHYAGRVGTGFDEKALKDIYKKMQRHRQQKTAYYQLPQIAEVKNAHWLRPVLVGEIEFTEWTHSKRIRHPAFKGLRLDKKAKDVIFERPRR